MNELAIVLCLSVLTWLAQPTGEASARWRALHRTLAVLTAVMAILATAEYVHRVALARF